MTRIPGLDGDVHEDTVNALALAALAGFFLGNGLKFQPTIHPALGVALFLALGYLAFVILPTAERIAVQYREYEYRQSDGGDEP